MHTKQWNQDGFSEVGQVDLRPLLSLEAENKDMYDARGGYHGEAQGPMNLIQH